MNSDLDQFKPVVNTLDDEIDGIADGSISLREALFLAQPSDRISFEIAGDIRLRLGQLEINQSISIEGPGFEELSIVAAPSSRIFMVDDQNSDTFAEFRLSDLTLKNGRLNDIEKLLNYGGAIYCRESLNCSKVHFVSNYSRSRGGAVGVENGKAELSYCYFEGSYGRSGAGILGWNSMLLVSSSQFQNNHSDYGGAAIYTYGNDNHRTNVQNCTFSDNHCNHRTNGIITNRNTSAEYLHCTIVDHRNHGIELLADEGKSAGVVIKNCIVTGNGTGVHDGCDLMIQPEHVDVDVISSIVGSVRGSFPRGQGNLYETDPMLGPLADNGGQTQTYALLEGSPAIDAGAQSELKFDQRGKPYVRVADGDGDQARVPDIGAFERQN
ncbi:MAG: right-handed parallel beta-helix repeat-containing protein [Planctomycetota bacterium]